MGYVLPGARQRVVLMDSAEQSDRAVEQPCRQPLRHGFEVDREQVNQIVEAALLDRQLPIHEGFAEIEARLGGEFPMQGRIAKTDGYTFAGRSVERVEHSAGIDDPQAADCDGSFEQTRKQHRYAME